MGKASEYGERRVAIETVVFVDSGHVVIALAERGDFKVLIDAEGLAYIDRGIWCRVHRQILLAAHLLAVLNHFGTTGRDCGDEPPTTDKAD